MENRLFLLYFPGYYDGDEILLWAELDKELI